MLRSKDYICFFYWGVTPMKMYVYLFFPHLDWVSFQTSATASSGSAPKQDRIAFGGTGSPSGEASFHRLFKALGKLVVLLNTHVLMWCDDYLSLIQCIQGGLLLVVNGVISHISGFLNGVITLLIGVVTPFRSNCCDLSLTMFQDFMFFLRYLGKVGCVTGWTWPQ